MQLQNKKNVQDYFRGGFSKEREMLQEKGEKP
jgi:hypothetical protein